MKKIFGITLSAFLIFTLSGCGLLAPSAPTPTFAPTNTFAPIPTTPVLETEIPLPTAIPPTATPSPTSTPSPVRMIGASVDMDNYALRTGPGKLFEPVDRYETGSVVSLIGREYTNNWLLVQTADNRSGWMSVVGLKILGDINALPVFNVDNAQILQGHVYLPGRVPAMGIQVAMGPTEGEPSTAPLESMTNEEGLWAIYLPNKTTGSWSIIPNAWDCKTSNFVTLDGNSCTLNGNLPDSQFISLPFAQEVSIEFEILPLN